MKRYYVSPVCTGGVAGPSLFYPTLLSPEPPSPATFSPAVITSLLWL